MAYLVVTCPHCESQKAALKSVMFSPGIRNNVAIGHFECPICSKPVGTWLQLADGAGPASSLTSLQAWKKDVHDTGWLVTDIWPNSVERQAPDDVPKGIERAFLQAEANLAQNHWEAAGMMYRRALELSMKEKGPELKGTLQRRIDALAADGRLTADMATWAHSIRELGNEAAHDEGEPTAEDAKEMAAFTRVFLEYLYTMPAKVERRADPARLIG